MAPGGLRWLGNMPNINGKSIRLAYINRIARFIDHILGNFDWSIGAVLRISEEECSVAFIYHGNV